MRKRPSESVTAVLSPVGPTTDTLAPEMTAPDGSVTVPPMLPFTVDSCAKPIAVRLKIIAARAKTATSFFAISLTSSLVKSLLAGPKLQMRGNLLFADVTTLLDQTEQCTPVAKTLHS